MNEEEGWAVEGGMKCPGKEIAVWEVFKLSRKMERKVWRVCGLVRGGVESM